MKVKDTGIPCCQKILPALKERLTNFVGRKLSQSTYILISLAISSNNGTQQQVENDIGKEKLACRQTFDWYNSKGCVLHTVIAKQEYTSF